MDPLAVTLVLAAAAFHATWNLTLHRTDDRQAAMAVATLAGGLALSPALVVRPPGGVLVLAGVSAAAETAYALFLSAAYRRGQLSLTYPIGRGTAPLLVTLGGWSALGQRPGAFSVIAACSLGAGLVLVATGARGRQRGPAIAFALLTGVAIACYSLVDARAVRTASPVAYLAMVLLLEGAILFATTRADVARLRGAVRPGLAIAAGSVVAYLLVLFAFQRAHAGPVATLREVSVLVGVLLARDRPGGRVWAGAALVAAGAILARA